MSQGEWNVEVWGREIHYQAIETTQVRDDGWVRVPGNLHGCHFPTDMPGKKGLCTGTDFFFPKKVFKWPTGT